VAAKPNILLMELTRVNESNPTSNTVALNPNKANGRIIRGFAVVAQYGQITQVKAHTFKVKKAKATNYQQHLKRHHFKQRIG